MGLSLGKLIGGMTSTIFPGASSILSSGGGRRTTALGAIASAYFPAAAPYIGATVASLDTGGGQGDTIPDTGPTGGPTIGATPTMGAVSGIARMIPAALSSAIIKLSQKLGGASGSILGYGRKVWASLAAWAEKNPGVSLVGTLISLGLTAEEAATFISWGATHKKRRHHRGITARDMRTSRRTMRKIIGMSRQMRELCGDMPHRRHHRRHHA